MSGAFPELSPSTRPERSRTTVRDAPSDELAPASVPHRYAAPLGAA